MNALSFITPFVSEIGCRLLQTDPTTLDRLAELDGKVIALDFESTDITFFMFPTPAGIRLRNEWDGEVDVHMKGTPSELVKMGMANKTPVTPGKINMKIEGDLHVGQQFKKILDDMQIDWEELLSQHIGDIAAHHAFHGESPYLFDHHRPSHKVIGVGTAVCLRNVGVQAMDIVNYFQ